MIDIKFFLNDFDRLCVSVPWAENGNLVYIGELDKLERKEERNYFGSACWGYEDRGGKGYGFGESYESLFTTKHKWIKDGVEYVCTLCGGRTKGDVNNPFSSVLDKTRDTCTQYKFEKYLVALAISCHDDLRKDHNPITFHLDKLPTQCVELGDMYDAWKILSS